MALTHQGLTSPPGHPNGEGEKSGMKPLLAQRC
jgi:hypothetical protein